MFQTSEMKIWNSTWSSNAVLVGIINVAVFLLVLSVSSLSTSSPAIAASNVKGWCTAQGAGRVACFPDPYQACAAQHDHYAAGAKFLGYSDTSYWSTKHCEWEHRFAVPLPATVSFECNGYFDIRLPQGECIPQKEDNPEFPRPKCDCNHGGTPNPWTPHPISVLTGAKFFSDADYRNADSSLYLKREFTSIHYEGYAYLGSSMIASPRGLANWMYDFQYELQMGVAWSRSNIAVILTPDGAVLPFERHSDGSVAPYRSIVAGSNPQTGYTLSLVGAWPSNPDTLTDASSTWQMRDPGNTVWTLKTFLDPITGKYDIAKPVTMKRRNGMTWTLAYGAYNQLLSITDSFGKTITFDWIIRDPSTLGGSAPATAIEISEVHLPGGGAIKYQYENVGGSVPVMPEPGRLSTVLYLDASGNTVDQKHYQYADADYPYFVTGILDKDGVKRWSVTYDDRGRAIKSTGPDNSEAYTVAYAPTGSAFTRTVTNSLGKKTVYHFTGGYPAFTTQLHASTGEATANTPQGSYSYTYGRDGLVSSETDQDGRVTTFVRNARGLPTQIVRGAGAPDAETTTITWDSVNAVPTKVVKNGLTADYTYDATGRLTAFTQTDTTTHTAPYSTNGETRRWVYGWSPQGKLLSVDGPLAGTGDTTSYTYDSHGYLASVTNPLGQVTTINAVNDRGQPTFLSDPNGVETDIAYDALGRVLSVTVDPGTAQATTSFTYNAVGDVTKIIRPNGSYLQYHYDDARRVIAVSNNVGERIDYVYNDAGSVTSRTVRDSGGAITATQTKTYDALNRLLKKIGANAQSTRYGYNKVGDVTSVTDPRSKLYTFAFDAVNRLVRKTDPDNYKTSLAYNERSQVASVTDGRSLQTGYVRDGFGDVIKRTSPDTGTTVYSYDSAGRMTKRVDARGVETDYTYDVAGRRLTKTFPASPVENVTYVYDAAGAGNYGVGRLTSVTDESGSTAFAYDALGDVASVARTVDGVSYTTSYTRDAAGKVLSVTYPSGRIVSYTRDSVGRISGITTKANASTASVAIVSNVTYMPFGPVSGFTYGNGVVLRRSYDGDYRLTAIHAVGSSSVIQDLSYGHDASGNITSILDNMDGARSQTFGYDDLDRLATATGMYGAKSYSYDGVGNRTADAAGTTSDAYLYEAASNRLSTVTAGSNTRKFTYLASGQLSEDVRSSTADYTFGYNDDGRMSSASLNGAGIANYLYNAFEQRVEKNVGGAHTRFVFDMAGHLLEEVRDAKAVYAPCGAGGAHAQCAAGIAHARCGGRSTERATKRWNACNQSGGATTSTNAGTAGTKEYIWLGGMPVAQIDDTAASPVIYYIHSDQLNRPQKMTDGTGAVAWDGVFDPFGNAVNVTGSATNLLMFPGQYYDSETQLSQNWHRDYDPTLGRYIESDPLGLAAGVNTYGYVEGDSVGYTDPLGLWTYHQGSGQMDDASGHNVATGYSGQGVGLNNPDQQGVPNTGPIPQGTYHIGPQYHNHHTGSGTMNLTPEQGTNTFGRDEFRIHGDNKRGDHSASEGCVVIDRATRNRMNNSNDHTLNVVP